MKLYKEHQSLELEQKVIDNEFHKICNKKTNLYFRRGKGKSKGIQKRLTIEEDMLLDQYDCTIEEINDIEEVIEVLPINVVGNILASYISAMTNLKHIYMVMELNDEETNQYLISHYLVPTLGAIHEKETLKPITIKCDQDPTQTITLEEIETLSQQINNISEQLLTPTEIVKILLDYKEEQEINELLEINIEKFTNYLMNSNNRKLARKSTIK